MKKTIRLSFCVALLAAVPSLSVCAEAPSLQQIADNLTVAPLTDLSTRLTLPTAEGCTVTLLGADYEQIIDADGNIWHDYVLADTPVNVSFRVTRGNETVCSKDYEIIVPTNLEPPIANANPKPAIIPELLQWSGNTGFYTIPKNAVDTDFVQCKLLKLPEETRDVKAFDEAYFLDISPSAVTVQAYTSTGLFWGLQSIRQMMAQGNGTLPCGRAFDVPRFKVRGFMLDVGRLPIPLSEIYNVIHTMAWYKMNDLQLHLNDNYIFHEHYVDKGMDPFKESYAGFRLESKVKGKDGTPLTAQDVFYTKKEFRDLVTFANRHGVQIVPEFDTPGHALSFTRVRPDLIYQGPMNHAKRRCEMLDAANPETLNFVGEVWDEYLLPKKTAVFADCPVVHVGSDEFFGDKEDYRRYADGILRHVLSRGYTPRIWGSLDAKPGKTPVVSKGVQMNIWSRGWGRAWESINQGYDIINTADGALYIVPFAGYYRMDRNHAGLYDNWVPSKVHHQTIPSGHPQLLGAMFAVWNDEIDRLHKGYMTYDMWETPIAGSIDVLSQKMWGTATPPRTFQEHRALVAKLGLAPGADPLSRRGKAAHAPVTFEGDKIPRALNLGSLGPEYHLTLELTLKEATPGKEQVLLASPAGQFFAAMKDGSIGFRRADQMEFSFAGAQLPVGKSVKLELIGRKGSTELWLDGVKAGTLTLKTFHNRTENLIATFILPLDTLGSTFHGKITRFTLTPSAPQK